MINLRFAALLLLFSCSCPAVAPEETPRAEVCLNGVWETVLNAEGSNVPVAGWSRLRTPAMPVTTNPPTISVWYRHVLRIPGAWARPSRRFFLKVEKAGHYAALYWNGRMMGEHYGQYTPFETDVSGAVRAGDMNEIAIFVHNASGKYVRPGAVLTDPLVGNAYRAATDSPAQRNWVGISGDITFSWRPAARVTDVVVIPSVRRKRLAARIEAGPETAGLTVRAAVLDKETVVLRLPEKPAGASGTLTLETSWNNPVLWGPEPYGQPKLYLLRTELYRRGKLVDRYFTRFGFREVWVEGRDVLLNGRKLWMSGTYFPKLAPIRYLNDRRPQSAMIRVMQESGLNALHGHWDDLGETWLNLCDETGILVLGAFYCDGRPQIQSRADAGWADWMAGTCRQWVRTVRNHPSIVIWRPTDSVMPPGVNSPEVVARLAVEVRREDGTRPLAIENEQSEINAFWQSPMKDQRNPAAGYDDGTLVAEKLASSTKPVLTKEIYAGFRDSAEPLARFFRAFYEKSDAGGSTGTIVQHLPLIQASEPFRIQWLSESGSGNRDTVPENAQPPLPNWCDPSQPAWKPTSYSTLFAELYKKYTKRAAAAYSGRSASELLVSGLAPDEIAILMPRDPATAGVIGIRAATDGTAWIIPPQPGDFDLYYPGGARRVRVAEHAPSAKPGYDDVERLALPKKQR